MVETNYFLASANSIYHDGFRRYLLDNKVLDRLLGEDFPKLNDPSDFLTEYPRWISSSKINCFYGLKAFTKRYISLGVTQALDEWQQFCLTHRLRLRTLPGEYPYTRDTYAPWTQENIVTDFDLIKGDALIISAPFSAIGQIHPLWDELMKHCEQNLIPVFVDCAFFGTCGHVEINLDYPAIQSVAFSTTKGLGCGNWRAGICFSKISLPHLELQTDWKHGIHLNVKVSLALMKAFGPDFLFETYRATQEQVCELIGLTPSMCVHLALGEGPAWEKFSRDGVVNRVGLAKAIRDFKKYNRLGMDLSELGSHIQPTSAANRI